MLEVQSKPCSHKELLSKKELAKKNRQPYEADWLLNLAFHNGDQWVGYDRTNSRLMPLDEAGPKAAVHNICLPITRTERAKLLKTVPSPQALPATETEGDQVIGRILNAQFRKWKEDWHYEAKLRDGLFWVVVTGNVFLKWFWGDDAKMSIVPPLNIYPDPYALRMRDCRWMIQDEFMDLEAAREMYDIPGANLEALQRTETSNVNGIEGRIYGNFSDGAGNNLPGVVVNEYWEVPCKARPNGSYVVFTEHGIVYAGPLPYNHRRLPYTHIGHIQRSNSKWYTSILDAIRPLQMEINRTENQIIENRNLANGKWYIPPGLELEAMPDASPRQILVAKEGSPDVAPQFININPFPAQLLNEPERLKQTAYDIAGQHEVSQGGVPGRVEAAQAIQLLQESDDSVIKDTIHSMEEAIAQGFFMSASNLKQYGQPNQILKVYDPEGGIEVHEFKTGDINLDFRIEVQTTTGLPQTIAGKWDRVLNLWQYKVLTDPNKVLQLLDMAPELPDLVPDADDKKRAYRENKIMASGTPLTPKAWDNHSVHRAEHERFMKTQEFESLDDRSKKMFEFHLELHEALELEEIRKEFKRQAVAQGQPIEDQAPQQEGQEGLADPTAPPAQENGSPAEVAG